MEKTKALLIGNPKTSCVIDETVVGADRFTKDGVRLDPKLPNASQRKNHPMRAKGHIKDRRPAQTIWKRSGRSAAMKRKSAMKRSAAKDRRSSGQWLWVGVSVGRDRQLRTHGNGKKRVTFMVLPRKAEAPRGKPRGIESISNCLKLRIKKGSILVFDRWPSTEAAAKKLGYKHKPGVNHGRNVQGMKTGCHSNDVESEKITASNCSSESGMGKSWWVRTRS